MHLELIDSVCFIWTYNFSKVVMVLLWYMASSFIQRYEKKYGRDENQGVPRCLMAAKFISSVDLTGERTLQHWIAQGQIQDLHIKTSKNLNF